MVESRPSSWGLSKRPASEEVSLTLNEKKQTLIPGYSPNPLPAMIIFLLGLILGGHHQNTAESTMMHKWVSHSVHLCRVAVVANASTSQIGNFLTAAAITRALTYVLLYISPARSTSPSRPPSELVTSFCLMSGGLMLMASVRSPK